LFDDGQLWLWVWVNKSDQLDQLLDEVGEFRPPELYVNGNQHFGKLAGLPSDQEIEIRISGLTSTTRAIAANLSSLLSFQSGIFLKEPAPEYYLVDEDYSSANAPSIGSAIESYQRIPRLLGFLERAADIASRDGKTLVYLGDNRLDIDIKYTVSDLAFVPTQSDVDLLEAEIFSSPFVSTKVGIFKRILKRFLESMEPRLRLGQLMRTWVAIVEAFHADFGLYESEFNFEKVREAFEQKKLDYVLKLNSATSDSLTKLLAIPVAQGLLVSQMKSDAGAVLANWALVFGALVFATIALLILLTHKHSIDQISEEVKLDRKVMEQRYPVQYQRVKAMYTSVESRARLAGWYPWVLGAVLALATLLTVYAFFKVPPFGIVIPSHIATG
jgi:hypothetical protein